MVELIDDFFAEHPATTGSSDKIDTGANWPNNSMLSLPFSGTSRNGSA
jgi:hypothetical protein